VKRAIRSTTTRSQQHSPYDRAGDLVATRADDGDSVLAICNTIDSARELAESIADRTIPVDVNEVYDELLNDADESTESIPPKRTSADAARRRRSGQPLLVHLTTRHRPCDRRHLIDVASDLAEAGEPVLFVSTQLVEAGVDVSFDEVIRDFAPMDSLVQAAGRCNRSYGRNRGRVTVWQLAPPPNRETTPASAVYGRGESLTKLTGQALATVYDGDPMPEPDVTRNAVEHYFDLLDGRDVGADEYVEYLERAEAEELGRLSLIDERLAVDVIVTRTADERETVEEIRERSASTGGTTWTTSSSRPRTGRSLFPSTPATTTRWRSSLHASRCSPTPTDWCSTGARDGMTATSTPPTASSSLTRAWRHVYCERSRLSAGGHSTGRRRRQPVSRHWRDDAVLLRL